MRQTIEAAIVLDVCVSVAASVLKGGQQGSGRSLEPVNKIPKTCVLWQQADEIDVTTNVPCTIIRNSLPALGQSSGTTTLARCRS